MTMTPKQERKRSRVRSAAYQFVHVTTDIDEIARAVNTTPQRLQRWMKRRSWDTALKFWGYTPKETEEPSAKDFDLVEKLWTEMIENEEHIHIVEYPDKLLEFDEYSVLYPVIESHLYCVDNLSEAEIRSRIKEWREAEGTPCRYEGQYFENLYNWWLYPNWDSGTFSAAFARSNIVSDLVIGTGSDTWLVAIKNGRLTITQQFDNDVVSIHDDRLRVCL